MRSTQMHNRASAFLNTTRTGGLVRPELGATGQKRCPLFGLKEVIAAKQQAVTLVHCGETRESRNMKMFLAKCNAPPHSATCLSSTGLISPSSASKWAHYILLTYFVRPSVRRKVRIITSRTSTWRRQATLGILDRDGAGRVFCS